MRRGVGILCIALCCLDYDIAKIVLSVLPAMNVSFLPARRYASAGYRDRNVSVCPSVCPSRAGIVSKRRKLAA